MVLYIILKQYKISYLLGSIYQTYRFFLYYSYFQVFLIIFQNWLKNKKQFQKNIYQFTTFEVVFIHNFLLK